MRISDQQLTFSSEYRQQQLQLRQQTTLPGQALPLSELTLRGEQVRYEEAGLSTLSAAGAPSDATVTPEQLASQTADERLLSRRDLLRQARAADEDTVRAAPSASDRAAAPAVDGQLEFYRQASQWLDQLSATDTPLTPRAKCRDRDRNTATGDVPRQPDPHPEDAAGKSDGHQGPVGRDADQPECRRSNDGRQCHDGQPRPG